MQASSLPSTPPTPVVTGTSAAAGVTNIATSPTLVEGSGHPTGGWQVFEGVNSVAVSGVEVDDSLIIVSHAPTFPAQTRVVYDGSDATLLTEAGAAMPAFDVTIPFP